MAPNWSFTLNNNNNIIIITTQLMRDDEPRLEVEQCLRAVTLLQIPCFWTSQINQIDSP